MPRTGLPVVRQDVRSEFGHGHELDHELRELERLAENALDANANPHDRERAKSRLIKEAHGVEEELRRRGYDDLADMLSRAVNDAAHRETHENGDPLPSDLDFS